MIEKEFKSIIDEEVFNTVKNAYDWDFTKTQTNTYYTDDNGILRSNRVMLRVREKDGQFKIQVKTHKNAGSPLQICEENEFDIDCVPEIIPADKTLIYTGIDAGNLKKAGALSTLRRSFMPSDNIEICLDKSDYLGVTDFEVEVEYRGDIPKDTLSELERLGVKFDKPTTGKYSRFLKRLEKI